MYGVTTLGELSGGAPVLAAQPPVVASAATVAAGGLVVGVVLGVLGSWAWRKWR